MSRRDLRGLRQYIGPIFGRRHTHLNSALKDIGHKPVVEDIGRRSRRNYRPAVHHCYLIGEARRKIKIV